MTHLTAWTTPGCYFGYDPVGHILVRSKHRDSSILEESNYDVFCRELLAVAEAEGPPVWVPTGTIPRLEDMTNDGPFSRFDPAQAPILYTWRASSSMVGWVEYLMIRPCREAKALIAKARELQERYDEYPILDEQDYSDRQDEAIRSDWVSDSLKYRVRRCIEANESIFAARHDYPPDRVYDQACEVFV